MEKVSAGNPEASIAIGFPALEMTAGTSGQITHMDLPMAEEDVYLSWIGSGFGIGVQGGLSMFFDNARILLDLFDGWSWYRERLNRIPQLRGNQINTWNGQWIAHRYNPQTYDVDDPMASFLPDGQTKDGGIEIVTVLWTKVLLGIARSFPDTVEVAYVYRLDKMNTTIGFIPFELPKIRKPYDLYPKYFTPANPDLVESLFGTEMGFYKVCQMGAVGVTALEPKGFRDCFTQGTVPKYVGDTDEIKTIYFNTYQIWLLAMLNNGQLWDQAQEIAELLCDYAGQEKSAKTTRSREAETVVKSLTKRQFIDSLEKLVELCSDVDRLSRIAEIVHKMQEENVPYFLTLIRFRYAVENKKPKTKS
jgi:hypothetical protein